MADLENLLFGNTLAVFLHQSRQHFDKAKRRGIIVVRSLVCFRIQCQISDVICKEKKMLHPL